MKFIIPAETKLTTISASMTTTVDFVSILKYSIRTGDSSSEILPTETIDLTPGFFDGSLFSSGLPLGAGDYRLQHVSLGGSGSPVLTYTFSFEVSLSAPMLLCQGFEAPMDKGAVTVRKNRALPLKAMLFDVDDFEVTDLDITAYPVIQVLFDSGGSEDPIDVTGEAFPAGKGTDGNQFVFTDASLWQFNLKSKGYSSPGSYTITLVSGDSFEYIVEPTCTGVFVID